MARGKLTPDGERIAELRNGLPTNNTQSAFATLVGISTRQLQRVEAGLPQSRATLEEIAFHLTGKRDVTLITLKKPERYTVRMLLAMTIDEARRRNIHIKMSVDWEKNQIILDGIADLLLVEGSAIVMMTLSVRDLASVVGALLAGDIAKYGVKDISFTPSTTPIITPGLGFRPDPIHDTYAEGVVDGATRLVSGFFGRFTEVEYFVKLNNGQRVHAFRVSPLAPSDLSAYVGERVVVDLTGKIVFHGSFDDMRQRKPMGD